MKTTTQARYKQRLSHHEKVQQSLRESLELSQDAFRYIEFEMGCRLVEDYFRESAHPQLASSYAKQLLYDAANMYWPWYLNQKRKWEEEFMSYAKFEHVVMRRSAKIHDYKLELEAWTNWVETHDKLRHFINQSRTLHL